MSVNKSRMTEWMLQHHEEVGGEAADGEGVEATEASEEVEQMRSFDCSSLPRGRAHVN